MKKSSRFFTLLVPALMLGAVITGPVSAQDKAKDAKAMPAAKVEKGKATMTVLVENDKLRAYETRYKPGDVNMSVPNSYRVVRTLQGGTLLRTYPDGKTEKVELKTGMVRYNEPAKGGGPQYTTKNLGKSDIVQYIVALK
jgi:hypothetical protein